jgi:hypothetical protein
MNRLHSGSRKKRDDNYRNLISRIKMVQNLAIAAALVIVIE